jgi:DNA-binding transcriptional regulator GbsR (MarR family)
MLEGVGAEIAASFPGITRLGGQIVAALYLAENSQTIDELVLIVGRSKSNVFTNLKALEAAGIVESRRVAGSRADCYALSGPYPDVVIGAYIARLRRVVADKRALTHRAIGLLGDASGEDASVLRGKLLELQRKYELFGEVFAQIGPVLDGPIDLEGLFKDLPPEFLQVLARLASGSG